MSADIEFRLLGSFEVAVDGHLLPIREPRHQRALAALISAANRVTPMDSLIEAVWGDRREPASARTQVQICVSAVRRVFREHGVPAEIITTRWPGYLAVAEECQVDALRFLNVIAQGRSAFAAGSPESAAGYYRDALALWRGRALAGLTDGGLGLIAEYWEQQRLAALEEFVEIRLTLGEHRELIAELSRLVREFPFREKLLGALMLGLYRDGQQVPALDRYRRFRRMLDSTNGLLPSAVLAGMNESMIRGDSQVEWPRSW